MTTTTFSDTKAAQSYVVPAGVNYISAALVGANGGQIFSGSSSTVLKGGRGAQVSAVVKVTPGETLTLQVGHHQVASEDNGTAYSPYGGGGGYPGTGYYGGNAGGGASTILRGSTRLVVAGGGGGMGHNSAGYNIYSGGDATLANLPPTSANASSGYQGGGNATQVAGGAGGSPAGSTANAGNAGISVYGGTMVALGYGTTVVSGGGGGGYYGGGSGSTLWYNSGGPYESYAGGGGSSATLAGTALISSALSVYGDITGSIVINDAYVPTTPTAYFPSASSAAQAGRLGFYVDINELHPVAGGVRTVTYQLSQDSTFATGVTSKTVTFVDQGSDGKTSQDVTVTLPSDYNALNPGQNSHYMAFYTAVPQQGTWYFRVKSGGDNSLPDSAWSAVASFTSAHVPAATVTSPTGGRYVQSQTQAPFVFNSTDPWGNDTIEGYQLIIENNATGVVLYDSGKVFYTYADTPPPFGSKTVLVDISALAKDTLLRWKVRVWDSTDTASAYTDYSSFYSGAVPTVAITSPTAGGTVATGAPTFNWTVTDGGVRTPSNTVITVSEQATGNVVWTTTVSGAVYSATPPTTVLVNQVAYSVEVDVTDTAGLTGSTINLFTTSYISPDPVRYTVDASMVNTDGYGYVNIDWSLQAPDSRLISWRIYRRQLPATAWTLIEEITDSNVTNYHDYLVASSYSYQYTVTQLADRSGVALESPVGTRGLTPTIPTRINLLLDPGDENASSTTWSVGGSSTGVTLSHSTAAPYLGTRNYQAVVDGSAAQQGIATNTPTGQVQGYYAGRMALKCSVAATQIQTWIRINYSDGSSTDGTKTIYSVGTAWAEYTAVTVGSTSTKTVTTVQMMARTLNATAVTISADAGLIEAVASAAATVGTYFDGSYGASSGYSTSWTGTAYASTSQLIQVPSQAESQINLIDGDNYWLIDLDDPTLSVLLPSVTAASETEEWDSADYNIVGRGRHRDYGDRLGFSGTFTSKVRIPERPSTIRSRVEALRAAQKTVWIRTPFGKLYTAALGNLTWDPVAGVGSSEMGDLGIPYIEVA